MDEMSNLGQSIHDDPYGVIPTRGVRQTHNEVHVDVFPFPLGNVQGLQISDGSQMIGLDPSTGVTIRHILCYLLLHSHPQKLLPWVMIHLSAPKINGVLNIWASFRILFFKASLFGTTSLSLNQRVPSASSRKQATFRSPSRILLLI